MIGKFITAGELERDTLDWGQVGWVSRPATTEAKQLAVLEVTLNPGAGHDFHKHPDQEEVIYVIKGEVEQWLDQEKQILGPGDSIFISKAIKRSSGESTKRTSDAKKISNTRLAVEESCFGTSFSGGSHVSICSLNEERNSMRSFNTSVLTGTS